MPLKVDLLAQITELQEAVAGMKGTLTEAVARLGAVAAEDPQQQHCQQQDQDLQQQQQMERNLQDLQQLQEKCDANTAQVLKMVLALKGDVTTLRKDVSAITERQEALQRTVDSLLESRRTDGLRSRGGGMEGGAVSGGRGSNSSGGGSNDSGVALLLERAHHAFQGEMAVLSESPAASTMHRTSDQDSLPDQPSLLVPPLVYDYVAGLASSAGQHHSGPSDQDDPAYDSDSSLTLAANKSISLSATISKELRAGMTATPVHFSHSHPHHGRGSSMGVDAGEGMGGGGGGAAVNRTDSDGSDQSRDVVQTTRRRRYEKGSSCSTGKLYGPLSRSLSQESATYQTLSMYGSIGGLYSLTSHGGGHTGSHHHYQCRDSRDTHRCRVARELLETEKKYCRTLWIIQDTFAEPLKKCGILSQKDINTLFPATVYQLYDKHCHLQHQLRERLASWQWQPIVGDILAKFTDVHYSDVLRLYTSYVNDFPDVLKTFHKLCRTSMPFTKFIKSCLEQPSCGGLDLGAFLLTPVQRIPRYILLMKQLLKYTDEGHPDFHHINVCLDRLKDFLERLNDSIEHSFQLVHATFSPGACPMSHAGTVNTRHVHDRMSRSPRRSRSAVESPTYSPERVLLSAESTDSHGGAIQDTHHTPRSVASPKRSISLAGGPAVKNLAVSKRRPQSSDGGGARSRSLPRAVPPADCHTEDEYLDRGGDDNAVVLVGRGRPPRPLPAARSVADITRGSAVDGDEEDDGEANPASLWEGLLAASEPSLLEAGDGDLHRRGDTNAVKDGCKSNSGAIDKNYLKDVQTQQQKQQQPKYQEGCPDGPQEDGATKKKSIKSSLKNMFTFKKRSATSPSGARPSQLPHHHHYHHHPHDHYHHHHSHTAHHHPPRPMTARGLREEGDYWDPQAQSQDPQSSLATIQQAQVHAPNSLSLQQQSQGVQHSPPQPSLTNLHNSTLSKTAPNAHSQSSAPPPHSQPAPTNHSQSSSSHYQSLSSLTPLHMPHPPSTPVPGQAQPGMSIVGDFVDEDGNPCSNV